MQKENFTYKATTIGYTVYYKGHPIGGAGTLGTATYTSDGRRRSAKAKKADLDMYIQSAQSIIKGFVAGRGPAYMREVIVRIDGA